MLSLLSPSCTSLTLSFFGLDSAFAYAFEQFHLPPPRQHCSSAGHFSASRAVYHSKLNQLCRGQKLLSSAVVLLHIFKEMQMQLPRVFSLSCGSSAAHLLPRHLCNVRSPSQRSLCCKKWSQVLHTSLYLIKESVVAQITCCKCAQSSDIRVNIFAFGLRSGEKSVSQQFYFVLGSNTFLDLLELLKAQDVHSFSGWYKPSLCPIPIINKATGLLSRCISLLAWSDLYIIGTLPSICFSKEVGCQLRNQEVHGASV